MILFDSEVLEGSGDPTAADPTEKELRKYPKANCLEAVLAGSVCFFSVCFFGLVCLFSASSLDAVQNATKTVGGQTQKKRPGYRPGRRRVEGLLCATRRRLR